MSISATDAKAVPVWALALSIAACGLPASAGIADAVAGGTTSFGLRYRFEQVDQDGIRNMGRGSTARGRLTWNSAETGPWRFGIEADYAAIAGIEKFNSTANGKTGFPVIADPEGFDLNQAFLRRRGAGTTITLGRQRINHGSQRFVGGVAFRNNEQTYDAVRVQHAIEGAGIDIDYAHVHNVNRIFGPGDGAQPGDWHGNSHLLRTTFQGTEGHTFAAFGYLLDFRNANGPAFSNATYGLEYSAKLDNASVDAAIARQSDWGDNPTSYSALYTLLKGAYRMDALIATVGIETLGSDGGRASFRTPLATLHKFQGWTDKFLVPPPNGVRDFWASVETEASDAKVALAYHDFRADEGGARYGREIGVSVGYPLGERTALTVKLAHYDADAYATDTLKFWVMVDWKM